MPRPTRPLGTNAQAASAPMKTGATGPLFFNKAGCVIAAFLIIAGAALDHFSYPDRFVEFAQWRAIAALTLLGIWAVLSTRKGARHVRWLSLVWLMVPQIMITSMIYATNGADSAYFAGLLLAMFAVGTVLPVSFIEGIIFGGLTLALYTAACITHPLGLGDGAHFFTHSLLILLSAITAAVCAWLNENARNRLHALRDKVVAKNAELREINHTLSQIKGQLLEREKMAAIGALSAGLLHELNNPVGYSMMAINMGLGMSKVRGDKMLTETLQDAREGMERIQTIVADLRSFAYQSPEGEQLQAFQLEKALRSAIRLASFDLKGISVSVDLPNNSTVMGDEPALIGVLINLLSNAALAVKSAKRAQPSVEVRGCRTGDRLRIAVRDNGPGIEKAVIGRVFEPFFTTRGIGHGLGLGLSISQAIVRRHDSQLEVQSEPGAWTEFSFELALPSAPGQSTAQR